MLTCSPSSPSSSLKPHMDSSSSSSSSPNRPSPRSLQGPRPSPLKVNKDSHKITKKPPLIPQTSNPPPPPPKPLIIYSVSPKIIHTNPSDFMSLVQQLTGRDDDVHSPAARFAAIQNSDKKSPSSSSPKNIYTASTTVDYVEDGIVVDRTGSAIPGILSPVPSSLQPISSSFFSPITAFDIPGSMSFLSDILSSPGMGSGGGGGGGFSMSPSSFLLTPSPGSHWDLFGL